jgi:hypothetical protein
LNVISGLHQFGVGRFVGTLLAAREGVRAGWRGDVHEAKKAKGDDNQSHRFSSKQNRERYSAGTTAQSDYPYAELALQYVY